MKLILLGAIAMACFIISLIFLRFWFTTRDRFFLFFAISFTIAGIGRLMLGAMPHTDDKTPLIYLTQLFAFLVIIYAIADKNRARRRIEKKET